ASEDLKDAPKDPLAAALEQLEAVAEEDCRTEAVEKALSTRLIEQMELKPRVAYGALRVSICGQAVSPPLFESMELLGKGSTLARLRASLEQTPFQAEQPAN